jgi:WD40 repeat protein
MTAHLSQQLTSPLPDGPRDAGDATTASPAVPGYELLAEVGRGSMGVVYKARQLSLNRVVALKMILGGGHAGPADLARFRTEAEAVARLQHPHVVQVHDIGEQAGLPYYSLEFCAGGSLADVLDGNPRPAREAAGLVESLARAVHAAHQKGVVHRDLKPANVLLAEDGTPKITDFGLARMAGASAQTQTGAILGTPSYMAPEQARGRGNEAGPAADVYALGAILYELLTGRPPFRAATVHDTLLQVVGDEPVPPRRLNPQVPRDLETVCLKCLQKEPGRRYASGDALADDLRRFLEGRPVAARPAGAMGRGWRWCRRNPIVAGLLGAVAASLLLGAAAALFLAVRADQRRQDAEDARHQADEARRQALNEQEETRRQLDLARRNLMTAQLLRAGALAKQDLRLAWEVLHDESACPPELRDFTWRLYNAQFSKAGNPVATALGSAITVVALSPDGEVVASGGRRGELTLSDPDGKQLWHFAGTGGDVSAVALSKGARLTVFKGGGGAVRYCTVGARDDSRVLEGAARATALTCSADGALIGTAGADGSIKLWDADSGRERATIPGHAGGVRCLQFDPTGTSLASAGADGTLRLWDVGTRQERALPDGKAEGVTGLRFRADGRSLAAAAGDRVIFWDLATGRRTGLETTHKPILDLAFVGDGTCLATLAADGTLELWDPQSPVSHLVRKERFGKPARAALSNDGRLMAFENQDGVVWAAEFGRVEEYVPLTLFRAQQTPSVAFAADAARVAAVDDGGDVVVWDTTRRAVAQRFAAPLPSVAELAFSRDGRRLAAGGMKGARVWDTESGQLLATCQGRAADDDEVARVALSPDGALLATTWSSWVGNLKTGQTLQSQLRLWDVATAREEASLAPPSHPNGPILFCRDGSLLAGLDDHDGLMLWDVTSRQRRSGPEERGDTVTATGLSPDGRALASGHGGGSVMILELPTGQRLRTLKGHAGAVHAVAYSPDGTTLATGGDDRTLRLWDTVTWQERGALKVPDGAIIAIAFSADGKDLFCATANGRLRTWDARPTSKRPAGLKWTKTRFQRIGRNM